MCSSRVVTRVYLFREALLDSTGRQAIEQWILQIIEHLELGRWGRGAGIAVCLSNYSAILSPTTITVTTALNGLY